MHDSKFRRKRPRGSTLLYESGNRYIRTRKEYRMSQVNYSLSLDSPNLIPFLVLEQYRMEVRNGEVQRNHNCNNCLCYSCFPR